MPELPEGVEVVTVRVCPDCGGQPTAPSGVPHFHGDAPVDAVAVEAVAVSDLPALLAAERERFREALSTEDAVLAFNQTLHGRGLSIHHDYEDTIAALQAAHKAALAALDSTKGGA